MDNLSLFYSRQRRQKSLRVGCESNFLPAISFRQAAERGRERDLTFWNIQRVYAIRPKYCFAIYLFKVGRGGGGGLSNILPGEGGRDTLPIYTRTKIYLCMCVFTKLQKLQQCFTFNLLKNRNNSASFGTKIPSMYMYVFLSFPY